MNMVSRRAFSGLAVGASAFVAAVGGGWPVRSALAVSPGLRDYGKAPEFAGIDRWPVSYTHLTLPTILLV